MPAKRYNVHLFPAERDALQRLVSKGKTAASKRRRAQIVLKADQRPQGPAWTDAHICEAFAVGHLTVARIRKAFVLEGVASTLQRKQRQPLPVASKLDGAGEAQRIARACSQPPAGYAKWTMQLYADQLGELQGGESLSDETVRRPLNGPHTLAKQALVHSTQGQCRLCMRHGRYPGSLSAAVCTHAAIGIDESSKQHVQETRAPLPGKPGIPRR